MEEETWHLQETYKSLISFGTNTVKFVLLVNGGAVIALLTFLGNFLKNTSSTSGQVSIDMGWAMGCFLIGIVVGGIGNLSAYQTQLTLYNEEIGNPQKKSHTFWLHCTTVLVVIGILLFGVGSILALLELRTYS